MKISRFWTLVLSILPFVQCKMVEQLPKDYEGTSISWGSGGGITGQITSTTLLDNGQYYRGEGVHELKHTYLGRLSRAMTSQLLENYHTLKLQEVQCDRPGNMYRFLEYRKHNAVHRLVWSSAKDIATSDIQTMYNILQHKIESVQE